jgi:hypothetical protein
MEYFGVRNFDETESPGQGTRPAKTPVFAGLFGTAAVLPLWLTASAMGHNFELTL